MLSFIYAALLLTVSGGAFATLQEDALKFVPGGKILQENKKEVKVQTPQGSVVEVEFKASGEFEEASGSNLEKDIFNPGNELVPLQTVTENLKKEGKFPVGEWSLEKSLIKGWQYEFEGYEKGQKFDYIVDAKSGKLTDSKLDN